MKKGAWTPDEDFRLIKYIEVHGEGNWRTLPSKAGLLRCGKGCRLRWMNYLRPNVKRGHISPDEEEMIIRLHKLLGNRWSLIAGRIPGRTDNEIKNYWNTHLSKRFHTTQIRNAARSAHKQKKTGDKNPKENGSARIQEKPLDMNATQALKERGGSALFGIEEIASILLETEQLYDTDVTENACERWPSWIFPSSSSYDDTTDMIFSEIINYSAESDIQFSIPSYGNEMADDFRVDYEKCSG